MEIDFGLSNASNLDMALLLFGPIIITGILFKLMVMIDYRKDGSLRDFL